MVDLVLPDLKKTTKHGKWWLGRKLKLRIHLGLYLLQQLYNKTDRQIEYDLKDNGAYQIFCGRFIVDRWHVPDHTKIEEFRSRLSMEAHQALANEMAAHAVKLGFADPSIKAPPLKCLIELRFNPWLKNMKKSLIVNRSIR